MCVYVFIRVPASFNMYGCRYSCVRLEHPHLCMSMYGFARIAPDMHIHMYIYPCECWSEYAHMLDIERTRGTLSFRYRQEFMYVCTYACRRRIHTVQYRRVHIGARMCCHIHVDMLFIRRFFRACVAYWRNRYEPLCMCIRA